MPSTESEYLVMSATTGEVFSLMALVQKMTEHGSGLTTMTPSLHCQGFKENSEAVELARTFNNISKKHHHFRSKVQDGSLVDLLSKVCNEKTGTKLQIELMRG